MTHRPDDLNEPRWLRLAGTRRAEPDPVTLARVRARLAAMPAEPAWVRWLARPAALALSAGLLVVSAVAGTAYLSNASSASSEDSTMLSTLLGDDGSYGLPVSASETAAGASETDSGEVQR